VNRLGGARALTIVPSMGGRGRHSAASDGIGRRIGIGIARALGQHVSPDDRHSLSA
jgi:hypothetical protein